MRKYSDNFNEIFTFFLKSYRCGILNFCGAVVDVKFDLFSEDGKFSFRLYENGDFKHKNLISRHPNILKSVICGKKSWGLHVDMWSDGIVEWTFTKDNILEQFYDKGIEIPESLLLDFNNTILKKKIKRNDIEINRLRLEGILK